MSLKSLVDLYARSVGTASLPALFFNIYFYGPEIYGFHREGKPLFTGPEPEAFIQNIKDMLAETRLAHRRKGEESKLETASREARYYLLSCTGLDSARRVLQACASRGNGSRSSSDRSHPEHTTCKHNRPVIQLPFKHDFADMVSNLRLRGISRTMILHWLFDYIYNTGDILCGMAFVLDAFSFAQSTSGLEACGYEVSELGLQAVLSSISITRLTREKPLPNVLTRDSSYVAPIMPGKFNQIPGYEVPAVLQRAFFSPEFDYVYDSLDVNDITEVAVGCSDCSDAV